MSQAQTLYDMLKRSGLTDDVISRGVRLSKGGMAKIMTRFGIDQKDAENLLKDAAHFAKEELEPLGPIMTEDNEQFGYEKDINGNITVRDSDSGESKFLRGDTAFELENTLKKHPGEEQTILANVFKRQPLREFADDQTEMDDPRGTYNFPFRGKIATASFGLDKGRFKVEIISLRDNEDNETPITPTLKAQLETIARKWIDKV